METGSMERRKRRKFTPEFKAEVVGLVRSSGMSGGQIAKELDLTETAVRGWVRRARAYGWSCEGRVVPLRPAALGDVVETRESPQSP